MNGLGKRSKKLKACAGKQKLTKQQAIAEARRLEQKTGAIMAAYRCQYCKTWHVGHRRPPRKK